MKSTNSIYDFKTRGLNRVTEAQWKEFNSYTWVSENEKEYNDPKYNWIMCIPETSRDSKYGRRMVSVEYKLIRGLTIGEFYGSGIVD